MANKPPRKGSAQGGSGRGRQYGRGDRGPGMPRKSPTPRQKTDVPNQSLSDLSHALAERVDIDYIVSNVIAQLRRAVADGMRDSVKEGISNAEPHRTWLAEIDRFARNAHDVETLRDAISAYLRQAGIRRVEEFSGNEEKFVLISGSGADEIIISQPAYIDTVSGRVILSGRAYGEKRPVPSSDFEGDIQ